MTKENEQKETEKTKDASNDESTSAQKTNIISEVQQLLQKIEENTELLEILKEFDEKSTDFTFKDILEQNKQLIAEAERLTKERDNYLSTLQRFKADFENYKKRSQKHADNNIRISSERIIGKIFEPIEDIGRAIEFAKENKLEEVPLEGIEIIYGKLNRILEDEDVSLISPAEGDDFDPRYHEAICVDPTGSYPPDKIAKSLEKGYKIKERVLRAAKVMVGAQKEKEQSNENNNEKK